MAQRIQSRRTKGWRMPPHTRSVARPSRWGNPYRVGTDGDAAECVEKYRAHLDYHRRWFPSLYAAYLAPLRGYNLECWCPLTHPDGSPVFCHADVLLEHLAALETEETGPRTAHNNLTKLHHFYPESQT